MSKTVYVSITGLKLRKPWHVFQFYWHAAPSHRQAKRAKGNIQTEVRTINGVHHTLTVWDSEAAMRRFLYRGAHKRAIKAFGTIATGKTFGFATDKIPSWDEVHGLWLERGRDYADG